MRLTKRAPDVWESAAFTSIFLASGFSCSQALSTPAHTQVTPAVGGQVKEQMQNRLWFASVVLSLSLENQIQFLAVAFFQVRVWVFVSQAGFQVLGFLFNSISFYRQSFRFILSSRKNQRQGFSALVSVSVGFERLCHFS